MATTFVRLPSTPFTWTDFPAILASAARISDTTSTPGAVAAARAALLVSGSLPAGHGVVGDEQVVDGARERAADALAEDGHERDQREPDHHRGRGRCCPRRVPHRVLASEPPGGAAEPRPRCSEDEGQRTHDPGRHHRDRDEQEQHAGDKREDPHLDVDAVARTGRTRRARPRRRRWRRTQAPRSGRSARGASRRPREQPRSARSGWRETRVAGSPAPRSGRRPRG